MPGADHRRTVQFAFAQWTAPVTAYVVDGVEFSIDVEHPDGFAVDIDALAAAGCDFARFTNLYEISHSQIPFFLSG